MSDQDGVPKLNQILAIEKGIKDRVHKNAAELYHAAQKPTLFNGFTKEYRKINDQSEDYPTQRQRVQLIAEEALKVDIAGQKELIDITASKDFANQRAKADIIVDGNVIVKDAPATLILWLEKRVEDIRTFVQHLPTLDEGEDWTSDVNSGLFRSGQITTHRTQKVAEPIVLYPATDKHPAQTQLITKDVLVGFWDETKLSGALPKLRKVAILDRVEKLYRAVKVAREAANLQEAPKQDVGSALLDFLIV